MTLTEHDAARLAEIREHVDRMREQEKALGCDYLIGWPSDVEFALSLLDARPHDAEYVTRAWHNARVVEVTVDMAERMAAAEARVAELTDAYEGKPVIEIVAERNASRRRAEIAEQQRDQVGAQLSGVCAARDDDIARLEAAEAALRIIADCPATMAPGMVWQDVADRMARYAREALQGRPP